MIVRIGPRPREAGRLSISFAGEAEPDEQHACALQEAAPVRGQNLFNGAHATASFMLLAARLMAVCTR